MPEAKVWPEGVVDSGFEEARTGVSEVDVERKLNLQCRYRAGIVAIRELSVALFSLSKGHNRKNFTVKPVFGAPVS